MVELSPFAFYLTVAVALIAAELLIFQLSVFWFLFIGFGALISAVVAWFFPEASWLITTSVFVASSLVISLVLYPPLKKWQQKPSAIAGNDAIGQTVEVVVAVTSDKSGEVTWSGTRWGAALANGSQPLSVGDIGIITGMEGIMLRVRKSSDQQSGEHI